MDITTIYTGCAACGGFHLVPNVLPRHVEIFGRRVNIRLTHCPLQTRKHFPEKAGIKEAWKAAYDT
jgi:hypothetical protein